MDGHQLHGILLLVPVLPGLERNLAQEFLQAQILAELPLEFIGNALELRQVVQALLIPQLPDIAFIAGVSGHLVDDFRDALFVMALLHSADEPHKGSRVAALEFLFLQMPCKGLEEGRLRPGKRHLPKRLNLAALPLPQLLQIPHLRPAEPPAGRVHNPPKGHVVPIGDQLQIGQHVQDLHPLIEADAAEDFIRDVLFHQLFLRHPGQEAGAVEDGEIRIPEALPPVEKPDVFNHSVHFLEIIPGMIMDYRFPVHVPGEQILLQAYLILLDKGVGAAQDLGRGAVILVQDDGTGGFVGLVEVHQEPHVRAPPFIDVLIRIPHNHQVPVFSGQQLHQAHLYGRAVLKFVHHDIVQPVLPFLPDRLFRLQQVQGKGNQVVEIQGIGGFLPLQEFLHDAVVLVSDLRQDLAGLWAAHPGHVARVPLRMADFPEHGFKAGIVQLQFELLIDIA